MNFCYLALPEPKPNDIENEETEPKKGKRTQQDGEMIMISFTIIDDSGV